METDMAEKRVSIYLGASSARTALGNTAETLRAMGRGETGLRYSERFRMYAGTVELCPLDGYTRFESFIIEQVRAVIKQSGMELSRKDTLLILSSTKGNIELLAEADTPPERALLGSSAQIIAAYFGCAHPPVVVSNACISGLSALIVAQQYIRSGAYRHIIVAGCDVLSEFITEGFASFKSISPHPCRPYDAERDGLSLGEACGALLLTTDVACASTPLIRLAGGAITNDANHISGPSRTGDGLFYAVEAAMKQAGVTPAEVSFINAHGTATRYNDEMESKALAWAGLNQIPLNSVKGSIGHTLGASGVVETILCAEELRQGMLVGTKGFSHSDTPHPLNLSAEPRAVAKGCCVKTASGFGGCNAALVLDREEREAVIPCPLPRREACMAAEYTLPPSDLPFASFIRQEFKALEAPNMKFYKMSDLCKALYVAVERLLAREDWAEVLPTRRAIVLANRSASLDADWAHQRLLNQPHPAAASPAVFVYTLANVAAGEMCIRHGIQGDNTFFIEQEDSGLAQRYAEQLISAHRADAVICGWCEYRDEQWNINLRLLKTKKLMQQLIQELKEHLIKELNLEDITPEDIDAEAPLFGEALGLDSIDALEIILILEKNYGVKITNAAEAKPIFQSVSTLAEYIMQNRH